MRPGMPNAVSITSIAIRSSHARARICVPTMRALTKYSSLWMNTRNMSEPMAAAPEFLQASERIWALIKDQAREALVQ